MTTKNEMLKIIELENPDGLRIGDEENGYTQLSDKEAKLIFEQWADARLAKQIKLAEAEAKAQAKAALLDRLGITADEAKLLLE